MKVNMLPTLFALDKTDSPNYYEVYTRYAVVKTDSERLRG